jgi:DNA-binding NarL/FixJ family response regulator
LCQELVRNVAGVRLVILTAHTEADIEQEAYRRGAAGFVGKWQMADQLLPTIQRACGDGNSFKSTEDP